MALVVSTFGRRGLLGASLGYLAGLYLRLYSNDHTPSATDNAEDFIEPTFDGYSPRAVTSWSPPYVTPQLQARTDGPAVVFTVGTLGGIDSIYGYWITDMNGNFIIAERFPVPPVPMLLPGATCPVTLRFLSGPLC